MEITPAALILVAAVSIVLGFLASNLLNTLRDEGVEPIADEDQAPPGGQKGRYTPVARLWRDKTKGSLVVEIDGKSLINASPLDELQRERLENAARDLRAFLGMGLAPSGQVPAQAARPEQAASTPAPAAEAQDLEVNLQRALGQAPAAAASQTIKPAAAQPPLKPTLPPKPAADRLAAAEPAAPAAGPKSIVMQIEDILQDMLSGSPLEPRGIHLSEDPVRGVIVTIGLDRYEGIDAVPDPEVKAFIRAAVQAWEQAQ